MMNTDASYIESHRAAVIHTNVNFDVIIIISVLPHRALCLVEQRDR